MQTEYCHILPKYYSFWCNNWIFCNCFFYANGLMVEQSDSFHNKSCLFVCFENFIINIAAQHYCVYMRTQICFDFRLPLTTYLGVDVKTWLSHPVVHALLNYSIYQRIFKAWYVYYICEDTLTLVTSNKVLCLTWVAYCDFSNQFQDVPTTE